MRFRASFNGRAGVVTLAAAMWCTSVMAQGSGSKRAPSAPPIMPPVQEVTADDVAAAVERYVDAAGERFRIYDVGGKEELFLVYAATDKETLRSLGTDRYVMTASLARDDGKKYGLDFIVVGREPESLSVISDQVAVRTVDGESRYEWVRFATRDVYYRRDPAVAEVVAQIENTPVETAEPDEVAALGETGDEYIPPVLIPDDETKGSVTKSP